MMYSKSLKDYYIAHIRDRDNLILLAIDNKYGFLFEVNDIESLKEKVFLFNCSTYSKGMDIIPIHVKNYI